MSTCRKIFKKNYFVEIFLTKKNSKNFCKSNSRQEFNAQENCFISSFIIFFIKIYMFDLSQRQAIYLYKFE